MAGYRHYLVDSDNDTRMRYVVEYKKDGQPHSTSCIRTFGVFDSPEQALEAVARKLSGDPFFRQKFSGGTFYTKDIRLFVRCP